MDNKTIKLKWKVIRKKSNNIINKNCLYENMCSYTYENKNKGYDNICQNNH